MRWRAGGRVLYTGQRHRILREEGSDALLSSLAVLIKIPVAAEVLHAKSHIPVIYSHRCTPGIMRHDTEVATPLTPVRIDIGCFPFEFAGGLFNLRAERVEDDVSVCGNIWD
jgi:hypothetical protein